MSGLVTVTFEEYLAAIVNLKVFKFPYDVMSNSDLLDQSLIRVWSRSSHRREGAEGSSCWLILQGTLSKMSPGLSRMIESVFDVKGNNCFGVIISTF